MQPSAKHRENKANSTRSSVGQSSGFLKGGGGFETSLFDAIAKGGGITDPQQKPSNPDRGVQVQPSIPLVCGNCGEIYHVVRDRVKRRAKPLCLKCRGIVGKAAADAQAPFITPESTKAERIRANGLVNMRIRRGGFKRPANCQKCEAAKRLDFHHPDYGEPDEGLFLCRSCHMKAHRDPAHVRGLKLMQVDGAIEAAPPPSPELLPLKPLDAEGVHELVQGFYRTKGRPVPADYYAHTGREAPGGRRQT